MNYNYQLDQNPIDYSTAPSSSNYVNNNNSSFWNRSTPNQSNPTTSTAPTGNTNTNNMYHQQALSNASGITSHYNQQQLNQQSNEELERFKLKLRIKENEIETLENENQRLHESLSLIEKQTSFSAAASQKNGVNSSYAQQQVIPSSLNDIFVKLSSNYQKVLEELSDTKLRLESLVTAYTLNPTNSITNNGRYDELEISHKILIKLENLKKENEELLKHLSFGKIKQLDMSFNLLKDENEQLKSRNKELLDKLNKYESNETTN